MQYFRLCFIVWKPGARKGVLCGIAPCDELELELAGPQVLSFRLGSFFFTMRLL